MKNLAELQDFVESLLDVEELLSKQVSYIAVEGDNLRANYDNLFYVSFWREEPVFQFDKTWEEIIEGREEEDSTWTGLLFSFHKTMLDFKPDYSECIFKV